jgi:acetyl-CoA synthetase
VCAVKATAAADQVRTAATGGYPVLDHAPARPPLIGDYAERVRTFTWDQARSWLAPEPGGRLNIAHQAVQRHVDDGRGGVVAVRFLDRTAPRRELTYAELAEAVSRFAAVLSELGVGRGDRVCTLLPRSPELFVTALGTLWNGSVYCPLFPAFGPGPVQQRLELGHVRLLVTDRLSYERKVADARADLPELSVVVVLEDDAPPGTISWRDALARAADRPAPAVADTSPEDPALLHFTSGTTGRPKGAVHVHEAVVAHHATARMVLDLHDDDVFWCTADPGWVTGTSYGIIGPLTRGATVVTDAADFDARRWYSVLEDEGVTVFYTAPTALRMLMRSGAEMARAHDLSRLRHVVSVGEPLNPEAVIWGTEAFGLPIHDTWWQTETGAIMISNVPGLPVRPGSMGRPVPGVEVAVLERGDDGRALVRDGEVSRCGTDEVGELALRPGWPSMFRAYLDQPERYAAAFRGGWYCSGDLARVDADGYVWFVGRADDVIKSAGHLIGPFEVESALMEHPAVSEVGVIGKPDPLAGEIVKAFVTLAPGVEPTDALRRELVVFGRHALGSVAPREIEFDPHLPHTRSGKVMRRLLKARELGLPEGDTSTVEETP